MIINDFILVVINRPALGKLRKTPPGPKREHKYYLRLWCESLHP